MSLPASALVHTGAVNILAQGFGGRAHSFLLGVDTEVALLRHTVLCLPGFQK